MIIFHDSQQFLSAPWSIDKNVQMQKGSRRLEQAMHAYNTFASIQIYLAPKHESLSSFGIQQSKSRRLFLK